MSENPKPLSELLAERIRREGAIPVAEYMELAAEAYYKSKNPFGAEGDFITAPEISQMFGEMIGVWLADIWMQMGRPERVNLLEMGPGRGTLAADILRAIAAWPDFKSAVTVHLVETSPRLRDIQAEALKGHRVEWHGTFSEVPEGVCLVVANEFFDALPVRQFEKADGEWKERCVGYDEEKKSFYFTTASVDFDIEGWIPEEFLQAPEGSIFESSPASLCLLDEISVRISKQGGAALIIDYGHDVSGLGDTLQAVSKHKYANPLENPGEKDITAHVDFGAFKTVAGKHVSVRGPVMQGQFLMSLGIGMRAEKLAKNANVRQRQDVMAALRRLLGSSEMGRLFKVMALTRKKAIIRPAGLGHVIS
ncbi:MAG: SAM-dependent methyltransferase [Pseudomonadota bacterium]